MRSGVWIFAVLTITACNAVLGIEEPTRINSLGGASNTSNNNGAGNGSGSSGERQECVLNSNCPDTQTCVFRVCSPPCQEDRDCFDDERCLQLEGATACVASEKATCTTESQCPDGSTCSDGQCRNPCVAVDAGEVILAAGDAAGSLSCLADQQCVEGVCRGTDTTHDPVGDGGAPLGADGGGEGPCENGDLRCAGQALAARLLCREGMWEEADACSDGQLCDNDAEVAGTCRTIVEECFGKGPGESFCDGARRVTCGPDLVTFTEEMCASIQHCNNVEQGCAACLANDFDCSGEILRKCDDDLQGFHTVTDCSQTTEPCNAEAGACTSDACLEGQKRCHDDDLQVCNEDHSAFVVDDECGAGLCDSATLTCDACVEGQASCSDVTTRAQCNDEGTVSTDMPCMGGMPFCAGGNCVQCLNATHCTVGDCQTAGCNGSGQCVPSNRNQGIDCDDNGGSVCNNSGECVECNVPNDCPTTNSCYEPTCGSESCGETPKDPRDACSFAGGVMCDGSGNCVECLDPDDCDPSGECYDPTCGGNSCGETPKDEGDSCAAGAGWVCDGAGSCEECTTTYDANCSASEVCRASACEDADHTHGWEAATDTTSAPFAGVLYWFRLPTLNYDATLTAFGIIGAETGASFKLALYADNGSGTGASGSPFARTTTAIAIGTSAVETTSITASTLNLAKDTVYWLAFKGNATKSLRARSAPTQDGFSATDSYNNAFPANPQTLPDVADEDSLQYAVYIRVLDTE
jgi:hypothetical protein